MIARRCSILAIPLLGFLFLIQLQRISAQETPAPTAQVEGISEYVLPNGLQVLLFPDPSTSTVTVNVTYRVGSRHEGRGEAGMAHLLEHMVFKGTPSFPNIWGALEDHGATFNGTTWVDRTNYYETLPATDDNLDFALRMEADRMVNSLIRDEDLAKEMTVVRNEFEMGENSPQGVLSERMMSTAYLWHGYGRSTIGNRSDIERVPGENLRKFYRQYYQPDNATLLVAGKFEPAKVLGLIQKYFAGIPRPTRTLDATYTEEPPQDGARLVTLKRVGDVAAVGLIYHTPAGADEDFPAVEILADILTDQPTGHLYRRLVIPGIATSVSGYAFSWAEPGVMEFGAQVAKDQKPEAVLDYMIETIEGIATQEVTDAEVDNAKVRQRKSYKLAMTNSERIGIELSESIAQGDWRLYFLHRDRLEKVTASDVQRVAQMYLRESNRTAGMFIPTKEAQRIAVRRGPDVRELVKNYLGAELVSQGEGLPTTVPDVEKRITRVTLPSGIKLAMLPVETRGDAVFASLKIHYGSEEALTGKTTAAGLIPALMMRGTKTKNYEQLQEAIDQLQSQINIGSGGGRGGRGGRMGGGGDSGPGSISASIQSDRGNFDASLKLLAEILRQPACDPAEFQLIVNRARSMIEQGMSDPSMKGMNEMRRALSHWPPESIHYVPTLDEQLGRLEKVTCDEVTNLYRSLIGGTYMEVAIVGDFDPEKVKQSLEQLYGSWKSPAPYVRISEPFRPGTTESLVINTPDKEMAIVGMGTTCAMRDDHPDYPALRIASYVLGQSAKSRLMTRLRHEGGLSYGAGAGFNADSIVERASLMGTAICAPQNATAALTAMREELQKWMTQGITEEELDEAKQSYALQFERMISDEGFLVGELTSGLELGRTLTFRGDIMDKIQALTVADIQGALERVFSNAPMVELTAGSVIGDPAQPPKEDQG
jgi:zinc protease